MFPFPRIYLWFGVGAVIVAVFLYVRFLQARVDYWRDQHDQVQAALNIERKNHKLAMDESESRRARDLDSATKHSKAAIEHLQERIAFHSGNADAILKRLRDAERSRVRPLAPSTSAPAECRDYESDPTRLSESHRGFLVGEAAAAERNGDLLEACRADYEAVKLACGVR